MLDQMAQGGLQVLGRFNTPGWPIKVCVLGGTDCVQNRLLWAGSLKGKTYLYLNI